MEKKNSCARAGFSTILWGALAILLCAAPCVWAVEYRDGVEVNIDENTVITDDVHVYDATVNLLPGAYLPCSLYAHGDSIVNIRGGNVNWWVAVSPVEPWPVVTVYGTDFAVDGTPYETPASVYIPYGTLTGKYGDGNDINLVFMSDVPIFLAAPGGGVTQVAIDIKPGSDLNPINPGSNGLIPVAIITTDDFDAADVNSATVTLAGAEVAVRGKAEKLMARLEDVDGDGDLDLLLQVETQSDGALWESGPVILEGTTYGGQPIEGQDDVIIVPPE